MWLSGAWLNAIIVETKGIVVENGVSTIKLLCFESCGEEQIIVSSIKLLCFILSSEDYGRNCCPQLNTYNYMFVPFPLHFSSISSSEGTFLRDILLVLHRFPIENYEMFIYFNLWICIMKWKETKYNSIMCIIIEFLFYFIVQRKGIEVCTNVFLYNNNAFIINVTHKIFPIFYILTSS